MATGGKPEPAAPPQAPSAAKGVFMRRIFPFLLATNVFIGVYVFAKTYKRDQEKKNAEAAAAAAAVAALSSPSPTAKAADPAPAPAPAPKRVVPPLSEDEQRQVYKWMLEEMRKAKPRDPAEKNKINEEKALIKEFIRAESLPRL
ncbi:unnamed protein product [Urochloa humidicola]